jgi:thiamine biosynthesis lipoprotein
VSTIHPATQEAMKTTFSIRIPDAGGDLAINASRDAFALLDTIEQSLSRYIVGSDIWQINHMEAGDRLLVSETCYGCLQAALQAYIDTEGLFDITLGKRIEHKKREADGPLPELSGQLMVDPERPAVHCSEAGREIDLGGIGKGYALDRMAELLKEWKIGSALISAGASTHLAFGPKSWEIELSGRDSKKTVVLQDSALSASGTDIQGAHIISPHGDSDMELKHRRVWVLERTAAAADAWSTAAMLTTPEALFQLPNPPQSLLYEKDGEFIELLK